MADLGAVVGITAKLSDDRRYRYALWRVWDPEGDLVLFIGLNPSTADESRDDPTIRKCGGFARSWGYGGLIMANLYAYRATDPEALVWCDDPVGPDNDAWLQRVADKAETDRVVAAWGAKPWADPRIEQVEDLLRGHQFWCLGTTKDGYPRHPLYQLADTELERFTEPADGPR